MFLPSWLYTMLSQQASRKRPACRDDPSLKCTLQCVGLRLLVKLVKVRKIAKSSAGKGVGKALFEMLLVGVQTDEASVAGTLAILIEIYYVFSFRPRIPFSSICFSKILV